jgi:hypothetical protein
MPAAPGSYLGTKTTGQGNAIPIVQTGPLAGQIDINALIGQMVDRRKMYYYDTLKLAPGTTVQTQPYQFFQTYIGQSDPYNGTSAAAKTELETNMTDSGKFNPPYDLILFNLGFLFWGNLADIKTICQLSFFEFKILEKRQFAGSMLRHPPGMGLYGFSTRTSEAWWNNGTPQPDAVWMLGDFKKYIPPSVKFSLTLNFPETYSNYYNTSTNLPADINNQNVTATNLPTLLTQNQGGNGLVIQAILNGLSDGPVS